MLRFEGEVVAVTGAGHGLGQAIATAFAAAGARVWGCDIIDGSATAAQGVTMARVDLTDRAAATAWVASVQGAAGGPVGVLCSNAGGVAGQVFQPIDQVSDADWDGVQAVNVGAAFAVCRAVAPGMKAARRGRIITTSSGAGLAASLTGIQSYCATKHALIGLTRQLAHELGPYGITVNSVAPGLIPSNPSSAAQWEGYGPDGQRAIVERIALKRLGTPADIANAVLFFASDLASFVNGQVLSVDGGR